MFDIAQIKKVLPIEEALTRYTDVDLTGVRRGRKNFNIRCPFHDDRTPSFTVYTDTNKWKCWSGCGGGDVIDLVRLSNGMSSTREAVRFLTKDLNLTSPGSDIKKQIAQDKAINTLAKEFDEQRHIYILWLIYVEKLIQQKNNAVKGVEDLNDDLKRWLNYKPFVSYWLDSLITGDIETQFDTLQSAKEFYRKEFLHDDNRQTTT